MTPLPTLYAAAALALLLAPLSLAQDPKPDLRAPRTWTNAGGKQIQAEYLGIRGAEVALKTANGKIAFVPLASLSAADVAFVKENRLDYHEQWREWPDGAGQSMQNIDVKEEAGKQGKFTYTTPHFRFECDVNLGATLMKDLARTFELTHRLHQHSPFGILAQPQKDRYEAKLFATLQDYSNAGGPERSAGVYLPPQKVFLAPLELMGVRPGSAGYRKERDDYDVSTIVHELTHMLTHDMLDNLPLWANEGYAEYISSIPIEGKSFQTSREKIREGVRDRYVNEYLRATTPSGRDQPRWGKAERSEFLLSGKIPPLRKVSEVLQMTDEEWKNGKRRRDTTTFSMGPSSDRLATLYRTSHLILYYFIQIEGEKGVTKIRRFLEENRRNMDRYERYREDFKAYEAAVEKFLQQPGVKRLADGRIQYPAHLTPPEAPAAPFKDPDVLKLGGLPLLLDGESAETVGARIESALQENLGMKLSFGSER